MNRKWLGLAVLGLFIAGGCGFLPSSDEPKLVINTGKGKIEYNVEIANTAEQRKNGLMFRDSLKDKHGMFFVFDYPDKLTFWMKNTLIPLDMIFFDGNYSVVHIEKSVQPCKTEICPLYYSGKNAQYVLETNAGDSDKYGIKDGDKAEIIK